MRHGKKVNHLSRKSAHRKAMLANMACSLIEHKRINTTLAKAKALRLYVEPIMTKSKTDTTHSRRVVFSYLKNKDAAATLFRDIAPKIMDRPGGYTRIIKLGNRLGDAAEMCMIELVDFNELMLSEAAPKKKSRRRRGGAKKAAPAAEAKVEEVEEAVVVEETTTEEAAPEAKAEVEATPEADASAEEKKEESSDDSNEEKKSEE